MPKIKICGLSRMDDISYVNEARPDYVGFVFAPTSKRRVSEEMATSLSHALDESIVPVGVFVNSEIEPILRLLSKKAIRAVQLHGQESPAMVRQLKSETDTTVIKAIDVGNPCQQQQQQQQQWQQQWQRQQPPQKQQQHQQQCQPPQHQQQQLQALMDDYIAAGVDYFLFDHLGGGSGLAFDWTLLPKSKLPFFLAGGLNEGNLTAALKIMPYAVDISSGVERDGKKDREKIIKVVSIVRKAECEE